MKIQQFMMFKSALLSVIGVGLLFSSSTYAWNPFKDIENKIKKETKQLEENVTSLPEVITGGDTSQQQKQSSDPNRQTVDSYNGRFNEFATAGGIVCGMLQAHNAKKKGKSTKDVIGDAMKGAAVCGLLGATLDNYAEAKAKDQKKKEQALDEQITRANEELTMARQARTAAEQLATTHRQELAQLQQQHTRGKASKQQINTALQTAKDDNEAIKTARKNLDQNIQSLEKSLANWKKQGNQGKDEAQLQKTLGELKKERAALDQQIKVLSAGIGDFEKKVSTT